ncbi:GIY-YIG nuclease family protein [Fusibacter sp. JL216-2]|uniref:GIY-YIG nuclease family protein n=1 Tax=Fusibacter sp. JL216-2 TaxID=3071453 RepID=UPI003D3516D8
MTTEKEKNKSFVYILHCADDTLYTGYTTNVHRRLEEHQAGSKKCKYTMAKIRRPVVLKQAWEVEGTKGNALRIEAFIKKLSRIKKNKLISNPDQLSSLYREKSSQDIKCWTIKDVNY